MKDERLLKLPEVSERLSLSRTAIYRLMRKGVLRPVRIGAAVRFPASAIDALIEELKEEEAVHAKAA